ncbi:MAG TPA: DUF4012 domain-containing protein [Mycobacteriales bacterium]|nr:DUF4012 domain-containing protein [Mycobacteriales bacterium]
MPRALGALLLGCVLAAALLLGWTAVVVLSVEDDLRAARTALDEAAEPGASSEDVRAGLAAAEGRLRTASGRLAGPAPALTARLPLVGRTPEALRRTSEAVLAGVVGGRAVLETALDGRPLVSDGRLDLDRLAEVADRLRGSADLLEGPAARLAGAPSTLVPGEVADGTRSAQERLVGLPADLREAAAAVDALRGLAGADGPRRLLVVLQNNAELRATGGLVSVFAEAELDDGVLRLGGFRDVEEVADLAPQARPVPAPEDYERLFGPLLAATTLWKNTNTDPHVPTSSAVLARVAEATTGTRPDAVLWLDVRAVAAVLDATSPAVLPDGTELTAANAVEVLLSGAYEGVADDLAEQDARRARLRAAADAVVSRLLTGTPDVPRLARSLGDAAAGRHLALWSADPGAQAAWEAAGLAGAAAPAAGHDVATVALHNAGAGDDLGTKLDYYARRAVAVRVRLDDDEAVVEQEVVLRNEAPAEGLSRYVAGGVSPGTLNELAWFAVPAGAQDLALERSGQRLVATALPWHGAALVPDAVSLPAGTSTTWVLRYRVPLEDGRYRLTAVPQPLAVDATLALDVTGPDGADLVDARTGAPWARDPGPVAFDRTVEVDVVLERPGVLERAAQAVRRFWSEPVQLPF